VAWVANEVVPCEAKKESSTERLLPLAKSDPLVPAKSPAKYRIWPFSQT